MKRISVRLSASLWMGSSLATTFALAAPSFAQAAEEAPSEEVGAAEGPSAEGSVTVSPEGVESEAKTSGEATTTNSQQDERWIRKYRPLGRKHVFEAGVAIGVMFPLKDHELFNARLQLQSGNTLHEPYQTAAPLFELRFAYFPFSFIGGELEGGIAPTKTKETGGRANLYNVRAHLIGQLPFWSVTPFILIGGGGVGTTGALGNDIDESVHYGAGVKFFINEWAIIRFDVRNVTAAQLVVDAGATHYPELLLGFSGRFGAKKKEPPKDTDGDGYIDSKDKCPLDPENFNNFEDEDGCPESDRDGDGFFDSQDACPDVPGIEPDGCPPKDADQDGLIDPKDKCPLEPETINGFEDDDGCPDEIPKTVEKFMGAIRGIFFDFNKATIKPQSKPVLDSAIKVLKEYPSIRIEVGGHTDNKGNDEYNRDLSARRAEAVRKYLIDNGIDASRIESRGYGEEVPIASNDNARGRAKNRRIEFTILKR